MPMPAENDDEKDGFMDRLAKSLFASPGSPFTAFADQQRMDRLEQCRQLERILASCQSANTNDAQASAVNEFENKSSGMADIPASRSGARIARFFKWEQNDSEQQAESNSSALSDAASSLYGGSDNGGEKSQSIQSKKSSVRNRFSKGCAIETHEMWACRALAVGCGNHLIDLRRCWSDDTKMVQKESMTGEGITMYNENHQKEKSCREIQISMARCVNKHAKELDERSTERVKAAKKQ